MHTLPHLNARFARWLLLISLSLLGMSSLHAQNATPNLSDVNIRAQYQAEANAILEQVTQLRHADMTQQEEDQKICNTRFQVNACLAEAHTRHLDRQEEARNLELKGLKMQREVRNAERLEKYGPAPDPQLSQERRAQHEAAVQQSSGQASPALTRQDQAISAIEARIAAQQQQRAAQAAQRRARSEQQMSASQNTQAQAQKRSHAAKLEASFGQ